MVEPRQLFGGLGNRLFQMAYIYGQMRKGTIPDIYVQDPKYFEHCKDELKALFGQGLSKINMVSLHIRRGDYVNNHFYVDLTQTDYYDRAIDMFPGEKFLVFCADRQGRDDKDREWCKEWLTKKGIDFEMWEGKDEISDFNAMASCKAHINANSTFSWWASFVGGGKTIAPKEYYSDGVQRTVYPKEFIVI